MLSGADVAAPPGLWLSESEHAATAGIKIVKADAARASALVASLVALVGVLACRWLFALSVLAPHQNGYSTMQATALILIAFLGAIAATGLMHLLMLGTARPRLFFGWIVALVTTIVVIFPFSTTAPLDAKIATAVVSLAIGTAIGTLVSGVAARSVR